MVEIPMNIRGLNEKQKLEFYAVAYFIIIQRKNFGEKIRFVRFAEPPLPDTICVCNQKEVGIEVAHLYGESKEEKEAVQAKRILGRAQAAEEKSDVKYIIEHPLNMVIPLNLNQILLDKSKKQYQIPTLLLIRNAKKKKEKQDFVDNLEQIILPKKHNFNEIWLLCDRKASSGVLKLYPSAT